MGDHAAAQSLVVAAGAPGVILALSVIVLPVAFIGLMVGARRYMRVPEQSVEGREGEEDGVWCDGCSGFAWQVMECENPECLSYGTLVCLTHHDCDDHAFGDWQAEWAQ